MSPAAGKRGAMAALALAFYACVVCATPKPETLPVLTTVRQIRALSPQEAQRGYPVRVRAVVTFDYVAPAGAKAVPTGDLDSNMFIQDRTGGNWVGRAVGQPALKVGDFIELEGTTTQTDFAPDIVNPRWRVLGSAPMPIALRSEFGELASTKEDSSWVELKGVVRSAELIQGVLRLEIAMDGGRVTGFVSDFHMPIPGYLVDAEVRIRGVCGALFNEKNQVRGVNVFIPSLDDIQIVEPGVADPFAIPVQSMSSVLRFRVRGTPGHRVRIHGTVSLQRSGQYAYVQAPDGSTRVESGEKIALKPGDVVDAVGFPLIGDHAKGSSGLSGMRRRRLRDESRPRSYSTANATGI